MKTALPPLKVIRGRGEILELEDGRQIVDLVSSWWTNIHGHAEPAIARAIYEQASTLEHVIFAGFTHAPAEGLAARLLTVLPDSLTRVFYSDNGSTAVEVALKMACQFFYNQGQLSRKRMIGFDGGYHGDTIGAMSLGAQSHFWRPFTQLMFSIETVPFPSCSSSTDAADSEADSLSTIRSLLESHPEEFAAIIIEPLVQGVAGMKMCTERFLRELALLAREFGVLLIFDEVMTGFGRTGAWFACNKAGVEPDIICLSKGITGGFLPLAVTCCSENIFSAFYSDDSMKALYHGHSYTANPIACAAAVASIDLLQKNEHRFCSLEEMHQRFYSSKLAGANAVKDFRTCGTIAAMEVVSKEPDGYFNKIARDLYQAFLSRGLLLRPLGNTIYLMPPYCISESTLEFSYKVIQEALESI
jgi:adenosylmethionine-8-amino-7-oxononanoate aminotransferase